MTVMIKDPTVEEVSAVKGILAGEARRRTKKGGLVREFLRKLDEGSRERVIVGGRAVTVLKARSRTFEVDRPAAAASVRSAKDGARVALVVAPVDAAFLAGELDDEVRQLEDSGAPGWRIRSLRESSGRLRSVA